MRRNRPKPFIRGARLIPDHLGLLPKSGTARAPRLGSFDGSRTRRRGCLSYGTIPIPSNAVARQPAKPPRSASSSKNERRRKGSPAAAPDFIRSGEAVSASQAPGKWASRQKAGAGYHLVSICRRHRPAAPRIPNGAAGSSRHFLILRFRDGSGQNVVVPCIDPGLRPPRPQNPATGNAHDGRFPPHRPRPSARSAAQSRQRLHP